VPAGVVTVDLKEDGTGERSLAGAGERIAGGWHGSLTPKSSSLFLLRYYPEAEKADKRTALSRLLPGPSCPAA
jgi:hypothetical protein